jgi:homoserine kinase
MIPEGLEITGCPEKYQNEDNLFVMAYRRMEKYLGIPKTGLRLHISSKIPICRGLGSSATLLVAGAYACNAMNGEYLDKKAVLQVCTDIEGHPDNVAPCIYGGMITSLIQDGVPVCASVPISGAVGFVAMIPDFEVVTEEARAVLPEMYSRADAIFNVSRLGVLIRAFETGDMHLIGKAMDDRIHQPYRKGLIHDYDFVESISRASGAAACCVSGSGSTCLAVVDAARENDVAGKIRQALADSVYEWKVVALHIDHDGAHIVEN